MVYLREMSGVFLMLEIVECFEFSEDIFFSIFIIIFFVFLDVVELMGEYS